MQRRKVVNVDRLTDELKKFIPDERNRNIAVVKASLFNQNLIDALDEYLSTGILPEISIDGINLEMIMKKVGCNKIQAFYNMDELMKDEQYRKRFMTMSFGRR